MILVGRPELEQFKIRYSDARSQIDVWIKLIELSSAKDIEDLKKETSGKIRQFDEKTLFNIKGNHYRLFAEIDYQAQVVEFLDFMTHETYNKKLKSN